MTDSYTLYKRNNTLYLTQFDHDTGLNLLGEWPCDENPDRNAYISYIQIMIQQWSLSGKRFHITSLDDHYLLMPVDCFVSEDDLTILPLANPHKFNLTSITNGSNTCVVYPGPDFNDLNTLQVTYSHICKDLINLSFIETEATCIKAWIGPDVFYLTYFEANQLKSLRSHRYKTPADIVYFILSLKKEHQTENVIPVHVEGMVHPQSELMKTLSVYFSPVACLAP
jgi:hypothetical protein